MDNGTLSYVIDGKHVIDASDPEQMKKLDDITGIPEDPTGRAFESVESNVSFETGCTNA